jgi:hypothetical protein
MILEILNQLEANNSRNFKIELLTKHKDNELLKEVCRLANDPFTQFYQRKIPDYTPTQFFTISLESAITALSMLSSRYHTGKAAINHLIYILSTVSLSDAKVIERIIGKDLKCGVSTSTINKVWPNLISEFPCMLCSGFEQKLVDKIKFPAIVQEKCDGMRFNAIVKNGIVEFRSRSGKEISLLGSLDKDFAHMEYAYGEGAVVFDGELLVMDPDNYQYLDRQSGNGILNKAVKGTISKEEADRVVCVLWDCIPYEDFLNGSHKTTYINRYKRLLGYKRTIEFQHPRIKSVETFEVHSLEQTQEIFQNYLNDGKEGIILKDPNSLWENKRSKGQVKFKAELDCDLKVLSVISGTGKYAGMLGALVCESDDSIIKVNVGSGFTDEQRKTITSDVIGKIVAVKYNARIKNTTGEESLFLPVFLEVREDKEIADSSIKIK